MTTKESVLSTLEAARGRCISGEALASELGISRAAVWKAIKALRTAGISIESIPSEGYRLRAEDNSVTPAGIRALLQTQALGQACEVFPSIPSTNTAIKQSHLDQPHGFTLIALEQTAGRGRLGRRFESPASGIYFSVLLHPPAGFSGLGFITIAAAVAVCRAISETCGFEPQIKWVNDILMHEKKLCGILTEATLEGESGIVSSIIVGIGINISPSETFPPELRDIVGTLSDFGTVPRKSKLVSATLNAFEETYQALLAGNTDDLLAAYRSRLCCIGKPVLVTMPQLQYEAQCVDLDENGHLLVRDASGKLHSLSSGEISIRMKPSS